MDVSKYSEDRYKEITAEVSKFVKRIGYNPEAVATVERYDHQEEIWRKENHNSS